MSPPRPDDLNRLIDAASREVASHRGKRVGKRPSVAIHVLVAAVSLAALIAAAYFSLHRFMAPTPAMIARDIEGAVDAARASVEQDRARHGRLPDVLPNAALASVVHYERTRDDYRLTSVILGVRVTLESSGKKTVEAEQQ